MRRGTDHHANVERIIRATTENVGSVTTNVREQDAAPVMRWTSSRVVLSSTLAVIMILSAYIPVVPGGDPLTGGGDVGAFAEIGLLTFATALLVVAFGYSGLMSVSGHFASLMILCLGLWQLVSSLWSPNIALSSVKAIEFLLLFLAAALIVTALHRHGFSPSVVPHVAGMALATTFIGYLVINVILWGTPFAEIESENGYRRDRFILGHSHPLGAADIVSLALLTIILVHFRRQTRLFLIPLLLYALWLSDGRASMVGVPLAWFAAAFLPLRFNIKLRLIYACLLLFTVVTMFLQGDMLWIIQPLLSGDVPTLNGRTDVWAVSIELFRDRPIEGYGYFASRYLLLPHISWAGEAHNSFIEALLTTGIIGFSLLVAFLVATLRVVIRSRSGYLAAIFSYTLLLGVFGPDLVYPNPVIFVLFLATINGIVMEHAHVENPVKKPQPGHVASRLAFGPSLQNRTMSSR